METFTKLKLYNEPKDARYYQDVDGIEYIITCTDKHIHRYNIQTNEWELFKPLHLLTYYHFLLHAKNRELYFFPKKYTRTCMVHILNLTTKAIKGVPYKIEYPSPEYHEITPNRFQFVNGELHAFTSDFQCRYFKAKIGEAKMVLIEQNIHLDVVECELFYVEPISKLLLLGMTRNNYCKAQIFELN